MSYVLVLQGHHDTTYSRYFPKYPQQTPHSTLIGVCGLLNSNLYPNLFIVAVLCATSCYIGSCYSGAGPSFIMLTNENDNYKVKIFTVLVTNVIPDSKDLRSDVYYTATRHSRVESTSNGYRSGGLSWVWIPKLSKHCDFLSKNYRRTLRVPGACKSGPRGFPPPSPWPARANPFCRQRTEGSWNVETNSVESVTKIIHGLQTKHTPVKFQSDQSILNQYVVLPA